jgi:hypothetical protein
MRLNCQLPLLLVLHLGANDMLKLRAMLEQPDDEVHALRVLRRLSMVPITAQLESVTGIGAFMRELSTDETVQAAAEAGSEAAAQAATLTTRVVSLWERQLEEERQQRDAQRLRSARPAPEKREKKKDPNCKACNGAHRAHTCK